MGLRLRPTVATFRWIMDSQLVHAIPDVAAMPSRLGRPALYATCYSTAFDSCKGSWPLHCTTCLSTPLAFRASRCPGCPQTPGLGHCCQWREKSFDCVWELNPPLLLKRQNGRHDRLYDLTKDVLLREVPKPFEPQNASHPPAFSVTLLTVSTDSRPPPLHDFMEPALG